jgi:hypothetical protein
MNEPIKTHGNCTARTIVSRLARPRHVKRLALAEVVCNSSTNTQRLRCLNRVCEAARSYKSVERLADEERLGMRVGAQIVALTV